jgi:glycosyltransferase involved in cell wall biosynthesis
MIREISVAICTYNRYDYLPIAVESLKKQSLEDGRYEILIVDNSDDSESAGKFWKSFKLPYNARRYNSFPPGLSRARNMALRNASSPIVVFMDDDAIANEKLLERYLEYFSENQSVWVAGGPILPIWSDKRPDWIPDSVMGCLTVLDFGNENRFLQENEYCFGANIAFRKEKLQEIGYFDENVGRIGSLGLLSNEEIIVQKKIQEKTVGKRGYCAAARMEHHVDPNRLKKNWFRSRFAWQAVSEIISNNGADYCHDWSSKQLKNTSNLLKLDNIFNILFDDSPPDTFGLQLEFIRYFVGELLFANRIDDTYFKEFWEDEGHTKKKKRSL